MKSYFDAVKVKQELKLNRNLSASNKMVSSFHHSRIILFLVCTRGLLQKKNYFQEIEVLFSNIKLSAELHGSNCVMSYHVISCYVMSCHVISCYVMSCHV